MGISVKVNRRSIRNVKSNIRKDDNKKKNQLAKLTISIARAMQRTAKQLILVDTGRAQRNTVIQYGKTGKYVSRFSLTTRVRYAIYIERMKPYMSRAYEKHIGRYKAGVEKIFKS